MWIGRWSLPKKGPLVNSAVAARWEDINARTIVESLRELGHCLVPKLGGVANIIFSPFSRRLKTARPLRLGC